jgi:hypothetical protein
MGNVKIIDTLILDEWRLTEQPRNTTTNVYNLRFTEVGLQCPNNLKQNDIPFKICSLPTCCYFKQNKYNSCSGIGLVSKLNCPQIIRMKLLPIQSIDCGFVCHKISSSLPSWDWTVKFCSSSNSIICNECGLSWSQRFTALTTERAFWDVTQYSRASTCFSTNTQSRLPQTTRFRPYIPAILTYIVISLYPL